MRPVPTASDATTRYVSGRAAPVASAAPRPRCRRGPAARPRRGDRPARRDDSRPGTSRLVAAHRAVRPAARAASRRSGHARSESSRALLRRRSPAGCRSGTLSPSVTEESLQTMRTPIRFAVALALTGALVTACSGAATPTPAPSPAQRRASRPARGESQPGGRSPSPRRRPHRRRTPAPRPTWQPSRRHVTIGTDNPATHLLPAARQRERHQAVAAGRPDQRPGFRGRVRLRARRPAGLHEGPGDLDRGAVQHSYAPGKKPFDF